MNDKTPTKMLVFIILCVLCGNGNHVSGSGSEYYYINITLCVLEVTGLARLAVSRSLMRPGRGHFFLAARLVSVTSRNTGADCTLANFFCKHFKYCCCKYRRGRGVAVLWGLTGCTLAKYDEYSMIILEAENVGQMCCSVIVKINDAYSVPVPVIVPSSLRIWLTIELGRGNNNKTICNDSLSYHFQLLHVQF